MKYCIIQSVEGNLVRSDTPDIFAWAEVRGIGVTGLNRNTAQRAELQGQPKLSGFCGPMWDGNDTIRYEDTASYAVLSA